MPLAGHPWKREFYVYKFWVDDYPFYVGSGRAGRGKMRLRRMPSRLKRSSFHMRVIDKLDQRGERIGYFQTRRSMTQKEARAREKREIARLIRKGFCLTNWQNNRFRHRDADKAVKDILTGQPRPQ